MSGRVFDGRSLDEALRAASEALGRPTAAFDYELVEGGRKGVFGLGARPVRIRIRDVAEAPAPSTERPVAREHGPRPRPANDARPARPPRPERAAAPAPTPSQAHTAPAAFEAPADPGSPGGTLQEMVRLMGFDLAVEESAHGATVDLLLDGPDKKRLTARSAEVLEALEFVLNRMARRRWPEVGSLRVLCKGFSNSKDDELVALVREVAAQVVTTGRPKRLQAMNPYERRVVHVTVREFPGLTTTSEGDGFLKRIRVEKTGP